MSCILRKWTLRHLPLVGILMSAPALAMDYPVSGAWLGSGSHFPGTIAAACFAFKTFGIEAVTQPFPNLMMFSGGRRLEIREDTEVKAIAVSVDKNTNGMFHITEMRSTPRKRLPWSKKNVFNLRIIDPVSIEIIDGERTARFTKCEAQEAALALKQTDVRRVSLSTR